jgi:hypothetical protein
VRVAGVALAVVIFGGTTTGCAQSSAPPIQAAPRATAQQACVQAVLDVLSGMFSRPFDNRPFQDFVTRYGTQSVTYGAYRDAFAPFYDLAATDGVRSAEQRLRAAITKECAAAP